MKEGCCPSPTGGAINKPFIRKSERSENPDDENFLLPRSVGAIQRICRLLRCRAFVAYSPVCKGLQPEPKTLKLFDQPVSSGIPKGLGQGMCSRYSIGIV